jgi:outer membrane protein OmpA-like peptidoglycan-associated protein
MRRRAILAVLPLLPLAACATGTATPPVQPLRVVFFEDDSVALGGPATAVVADAAREAVANPSLPVRVTGYIAPEPGQAPTVALARARAERVANELVRLGVARERVQVQGRGPVAFDLAPVESRRVEIRLGGT